LTFYFVSRNNKLNKSIQLTSKKLSDLEDKVNRQDVLINQLLRVINNLPSISIDIISNDSPAS